MADQAVNTIPAGFSLTKSGLTISDDFVAHLTGLARALTGLAEARTKLMRAMTRRAKVAVRQTYATANAGTAGTDDAIRTAEALADRADREAARAASSLGASILSGLSGFGQFSPGKDRFGSPRF